MKTNYTLNDLFAGNLVSTKTYNKIHDDLEKIYVGTPFAVYDRINHVPIHELIEAYTYRFEATGKAMSKNVASTLYYYEDKFIEC